MSPGTQASESSWLWSTTVRSIGPLCGSPAGAPSIRGGRVALLHVIEPAELQHWMAVEEVIREQRRLEAEQLLQRVAKEVNALTGTLPALHLREGAPREELLRLIEEEPSISILVLGARSSGDSPGPLIQFLTGKGARRLRIPVTIVPGGLTIEEIDDLG